MFIFSAVLSWKTLMCYKASLCCRLCSQISTLVRLPSSVGQVTTCLYEKLKNGSQTLNPVLQQSVYRENDVDEDDTVENVILM